MEKTELRSILKTTLPRVNADQQTDLASLFINDLRPLGVSLIAARLMRCYSAEVGQALGLLSPSMTPEMKSAMAWMGSLTLAKLALGVDLYLRERNSRDGRLRAAYDAWQVLAIDATTHETYITQPLSY